MAADPRGRVRWLTPAVVGFSVASLFSDLGHEWVTALLPGFLAGLDAPPVALGVVEGISNLGQALAGWWGGQLADRSLHRQAWILLGYVATALKAGLAWVYLWPWVVVLRTLAWIGRGLRGPLRNTVLAEEVPAEHRGKAFGFREAWDTAGAVLGPLVALVLLPHLALRPQLALSALPGVAALLAVAVWIHPRPPSSAPAADRDRLVPLGPAFRRTAHALIQFQLAWVAPTLFILRVERSQPGGHPAVALAVGLYVLHNVAYAVTAFPVGAWVDRHTPESALILGGGLATLLLAVFALPGVHPALWALAFVAAGMVTALWETAQKPWILRTLNPEARGAGFGYLAVGLGLAQLAGNLLVTGLWSAFHAPPAFLTAAVLAALATLRLVQLARGAR
ncbi:MFS domain-containing protein [Candidatus Hydrogenisulfobacillus filiaventi]|uniref:MFS domain-containing protein n=1 Tax=Candidatus Hydrogenisulfobacillus filiaventi TaxID=2707344 RepID=A0A6F8ZDK4_9FIRM|nr:MFS transporter [Bacillota bacterium]CAB1127532.1 MFS domain-containing protein [Candidatus Hydrogenisulfobacillus filiaventi]